MKISYKSARFVLLLLPIVFAPSAMAKRISRKQGPSSLDTTVTPAMLHNKIIFLRDLNVWMVDPDTRRERMILKNPFPKNYLQPGSYSWYPSARSITFSPDRKHLVVSGKTMFIIHFGRSGKERITYTHAENVRDPQWSPDARQIAYTETSDDHMGGPGSSAFAHVHLINADGTSDHHLFPDTDIVNLDQGGAVWKRDGQRPISPAAESEVRNERSCRRSGAAPC